MSEQEQALETRIEAHRRYSEHSLDFFAWVVDQIPWRGGEIVLDVGCGNGVYFSYTIRHAHRVVALDRDASMLAASRSRHVERVHLLQGEATALPVPPATFDVVFANHVLFFVEDIDRALDEAHRVLKAGGIFVTTTNTAQSQQALYALHAQVLHRLGRLAAPPVHSRFPLEEGAKRVQARFGQVEVHRHENAFLFPTVDAAMRYYLSGLINAVVGPPLSPEERHFVIDEMRRRIRHHVEREGVWRVPKDAGVILATKGSRVRA